MPRFFAHCRDGLDLIDRVGFAAASDEQLRSAAACYAGLLIADAPLEWAAGDAFLEVTDARGRLRLRARLCVDLFDASAQRLSPTSLRLNKPVPPAMAVEAVAAPVAPPATRLRATRPPSRSSPA